MATLKPGDPAPAFSLSDQHGSTVALGDFKGSKLLVYFYPKADTPGCTKQSCAVSEAHRDFESAGIAAVGISPDPPSKQLKFDSKYGLGFPLLSDPDHAVADAYGVWGPKQYMGKSYDGIHRSSFLIDETGRIEQAWYDVKPDDTVPNALASVS
jgi:peroxiredoxin Q/BCP